jgi:hypothetical protein
MNIKNLYKIDDYDSKWLQVRTNWLRLAIGSSGGATRSGGKSFKKEEGCPDKVHWIRDTQQITRQRPFGDIVIDCISIFCPARMPAIGGHSSSELRALNSELCIRRAGPEIFPGPRIYHIITQLHRWSQSTAGTFRSSPHFSSLLL